MVDEVTISKGDLAQRDRKITEQQKKLDGQDTTIKELMTRLDAVEKSGAKNKSTKISASFNKEDEDTLGELAEPIQRFIVDAMQGFTGTITPQLETMAKSMTDLQAQVKSQNQNLFSGVATSAIKNFHQVKDTEEFKEVLERRVPGANIYFSDLWKDAEERNDIASMQEIVDMVQIEESDNGDEPEPAANAGDGGNFEPTGNAPDAGNITGQFKYKASDMQVKIDQLKVGEITAEEMEAFEEKFNEAIDQGQVMNDLEPQDTD